MVIDRCKASNFTLSGRKLEIGEEVEFTGQIVSRHRVRPNPKFLQGMRDFPAPCSVTELRSFLGMINNIASYHPNVARHTTPHHFQIDADFLIQMTYRPGNFFFY